MAQLSFIHRKMSLLPLSAIHVHLQKNMGFLHIHFIGAVWHQKRQKFVSRAGTPAWCDIPAAQTASSAQNNPCPTHRQVLAASSPLFSQS